MKRINTLCVGTVSLLVMMSTWSEAEACRRNRIKIPCWARCIEVTYTVREGRRIINCPEDFVCYCCTSTGWVLCGQNSQCPDANSECFHKDISNPHMVLPCLGGMIPLRGQGNCESCQTSCSTCRCAMVCDCRTRKFRFARPCEKPLGYFKLERIGQCCPPSCPGC